MHHGGSSILCPLVNLLEGDGIKTGKVVKLDVLHRTRGLVSSTYTGFADFRDLERSTVEFRPMNSNRAVNPQVVEERVRSNELAFDRNGYYLEFGQITLLVLRYSPLREFLVMDGQHRCVTMKELCRRYPDRPINFQFRAKVSCLPGNSPKRFRQMYAPGALIWMWPSCGAALVRKQSGTIRYAEAGIGLN